MGFVLAFGVLGASPASAATLPVWPAASELSLPSNAIMTTGAQDASLVSVSCTSQGNCAAGGYYRDTSGAYQAIVVTETGGSWGQTSVLSLPSNATTTAGAQDAGLFSVSCMSQGNCAAVGDYVDTGGSQQAMVATETNGIWGQASEASLPSDAKTIAPSGLATLESVSCTSQGNCAAGGRYKDTAGARQAMIVTETGGSWGQARELSLPSNATTTAGAQYASLLGVSCTSQGNCAAGGLYRDTSGASQAMVVSEMSGSWGQASMLSLPSNATTTAGAQSAAVGSVSCTSQGNCAAGGDYKDTSGAYHAMVVAETGGGWEQASELSVPSGAQSASLRSLSCTGQGYCVAGGDYEDADGAFQAMVVSSVPSLAVSSASLPSAVQGTPYRAQLTAAGGAGNYSWSIASGSLPAGLSLSSNGTITGTPTAFGTSSFTVQVSDPGPPSQRATKTASITVGQPPPVTTVARIGDQKLSLKTPSPIACVARSGGLAVRLNSTRTSSGAKLRFSDAAFYIDKGAKHKVRRRLGRKRRLLTVYLPNATKHRVPAMLDMSLAHVGAGTHTLKVIASYKKTVRTHGHRTTLTVTKALRVKFNVC